MGNRSTCLPFQHLSAPILNDLVDQRVVTCRQIQPPNLKTDHFNDNWI